ncbi:MAG: NAD-binding protein [Clostridia bacterium]|nr:NAD-binding protein [Clostridia bacterium]
MSKIAVVGAGKTGRGFIGRLLAEDNAEIVFIDKDKVLVDELNAKGEFTVRFFGNVREPFTVKNFKAYTWENADIDGCELILVSVGGQNLPDVGASLAGLLKDNVHYTIITCENSSKPSAVLSAAIGNMDISVSEATVFCTTTDSGLDIDSENYPYLQCNADLLGGYDVKIRGIRPIENFGNFLTRKLYTYNAASCVIAYLGYVKGYTDYAKAANDEEILRQLDKNYEVTNKVLCKEFGYDEADQAEFAALSKEKFCSKTIVDTVARNARDPERKLAKGERIMGPMCLIYENGIMPEVLIKTAAAALLYDNEKDVKWREIKASKSNGEILTDVCGLEKDGVLYNAILDEVEKIK